MNAYLHLDWVMGCKKCVSCDHEWTLSVNLHLNEKLLPPGATQPIVGVYFTALYRALASSHTRLLDHTQRRATVGRTPLDE